MASDRRILTDRQQDAFDELDRTPPKKGGTPTFAGQVYDGGSMPTTAPAWYLTHPVEFGCTESEGGPCPPTADANASIPVIVLENPASVGDILLAEMIGSKWVAERGGPCRITICVAACGGIPIFGATVTVVDGNGKTVASCVTGATGCCRIEVAAGTYTIQVAYGGGVVFSALRKLACGGTLSIALGSNAGLICCGGYAIPQKLTLTDGAGTIDFWYYGNFFFPIWFGGHSVQRQSCPVTTPNNVCVVGPASNGPVKVCYQMVCFAGQTPTFSIQRSWSWVYQQGTLTPIWYQDASGITPGLPCATSPPAICGSPLTDTAAFAANPSSTSPFILTGSPVAAAANSTADPVGGGVVISA